MILKEKNRNIWRTLIGFCRIFAIRNEKSAVFIQRGTEFET